MNILTYPVISFLDFLSPRHCEICDKYTGSSINRLEFICDSCLDSIPLAPLPDELMNKLISNFPPDELAISNICSLFSVSENYKFMDAIYSLKYRGFTRIGKELGTLLASRLIQYNMTNFDYIIPVPIHHARQRERGFNQSYMIAHGIASVLNIPLSSKIIKRKIYTQTQTVLNKEQRRHNVSEAFERYSTNVNIQNKGILIVDDVLTTGSTLNAASNMLLEIGARKISAATVATVY